MFNTNFKIVLLIKKIRKQHKWTFHATQALPLGSNEMEGKLRPQTHGSGPDVGRWLKLSGFLLCFIFKLSCIRQLFIESLLWTRFFITRWKHKKGKVIDFMKIIF